jgi:predicted deacylase
MTSLLDAITWRTTPLPAGAANRQIELAVGQVGDDSPVALITAGVHGDEGPWGARAIYHLLASLPLEALRGTLQVVPAANPLAMEADARNAPLDTLDLNRTFPGDDKGSYTERLAAALVREAVTGSDVVIDLHGGGSWCVNAFAFQMPGGEHLTRAMGAPFIVNAPERGVTLTGYARSLGARVAAVEMGGRSEDEELWALHIAEGLHRALAIVGVLTSEPENPAPDSVLVGSTHVLRPAFGGVFIPRLRAEDVGTLVDGGTVLGEMIDPVTQRVTETFVAPYTRTAILLLRPTIARLEGGAMTYVVAEPL